MKLLDDQSIKIIVVEHKDRLTRFGFNYVELWLQQTGRQLEVVNLAAEGTEDLGGDLVAIIYSFCARLYGQRRAKHKTEQVKQTLQADD
jgi:putative resolvase